MSDIVGIGPNQFVHVLNVTTSITSLEIGPKTLVLQINELLTVGPLPCVVVPPGHYCIVKDPIRKYELGKPCQLRHGHFEVRFHKEPFALYPGESLVDAEDFTKSCAGKEKTYLPAIKTLPVVKAHHALLVMARVDHDDGGEQRKAGDTWHVEGPVTYKPTAEVEIVSVIKPHVINYGQALRIQAKQDFIDRNDVQRVTGEEWLVKKPGAYLPGVYEQIVQVLNSYTLTQEDALHLRATQKFTDALGIDRLAGEEWLLTCDQTESYIPDVGVKVLKEIKKTVLEKNEYCVVVNPVKDGHCMLGQQELREGITNFFLHPGEKLLQGIQKTFILMEDQALVVQAQDEFTDTSTSVMKKRHAGDRWLIRGPCTYVPPIQVKIIKKPDGSMVRSAIALRENEGIYIRHLQTGRVRAIMGPQSYLLQEYEELWQKELTPLLEDLLRHGGGQGGSNIRKMAYFESSIEPSLSGNKTRDKTKVVTYRCPGNTAVQVYNYEKKTARVVFGPNMVLLGPDENFNILSLSAGKPKKENALKTICLMLGPDFMSDSIEVETSDHARLRIFLAFNNHFEFTHGILEEELKIFSVPDFIGFACKQVGSRIRGVVAQTPFDTFHRYSAKIIREAIFGVDKKGKIGAKLQFDVNGLCVTNIDIQSIEPVDTHMRDSLMKSVQMAIEISTKSIEATAFHEARRIEQEARGLLERQKILNEQAAERSRNELYELKAVTAAVESTGQAKAEAQARAEKLLIEGRSEIEVARLKAHAEEIEANTELESLEETRAAELAYKSHQIELEVNKSRDLVDIEVSQFSEMINALGANTVAEIAKAGPQQQVDLLKGLGIESTLIMSGDSPLNLFNVAQGLVGNGLNN